MKQQGDFVLLICPKVIAGISVDDKFFRNRHKKETSSTTSSTVFERMLETDWEKLEKKKDEDEHKSLEIFNVTYNICWYKNTSII